jgi:hypothetical protein
MISIENDDQKIMCSYDYVLPSLCTQVIIPREGLFKWWVYIFENCLEKPISFSIK